MVDKTDYDWSEEHKLWLAILRRDLKLAQLDDKVCRAKLEMRGFPAEVIEKFIAWRSK